MVRSERAMNIPRIEGAQGQKSSLERSVESVTPRRTLESARRE